jgi:hypothetical protein
MNTKPEAAAERLNRVLTLDGSEFLGQAYLLVLGRPIDPEGFRHYGLKLRSGTSKLSILAMLRASPEGQAYRGDVPKLFAANIRELLELDGAAFIDCAYKTLLHRAPDPAGFENYLRLLRSGASKMRIVAALHFSTEARGRASPRGLKRAIVRYWLAHSKLTGWWYRPIAQVEGDTPIECRLRAIESTLRQMAHDRESELRDLDTAANDVERLLKALAERRRV